MTDPVPSKERCNCPNGSYGIKHTTLCYEEQLATARRTAEYWKAEHLAGNAEITSLREDCRRWENAHKILLSENERLKRPAHEPQPNASLSQMVDRFLAWPLPKSVCSDACVTDSNYPHPRSGTNLLTADEARSMLEYVTRTAPEPRPARLPIPADWDLASRLNVVYNRLFLDCRLCEQEEAEILFAAIGALRAAQPPEKSLATKLGEVLIGRGFYDRLNDLTIDDTPARILAEFLKDAKPIVSQHFGRTQPPEDGPK